MLKITYFSNHKYELTRLIFGGLLIETLGVIIYQAIYNQYFGPSSVSRAIDFAPGVAFALLLPLALVLLNLGILALMRISRWMSVGIIGSIQSFIIYEFLASTYDKFSYGWLRVLPIGLSLAALILAWFIVTKSYEELPSAKPFWNVLIITSVLSFGLSVAIFTATLSDYHRAQNAQSQNDMESANHMIIGN